MAKRETRQERRAREREQRKAERTQATRQTAPEPGRTGTILPLVLSALVGMILTLVGMKLFLPSPKEEAPKQQVKSIHIPNFSLRGKTYGNVLELAHEEVPAADIAELNLLCGSGLKGTEGIDIDECLKRLGRITEMVKAETERNWSRWQRNPAEYRNSLAHYRMGMVITVIRQDYKARYNPDLITAPGEKGTQDDSFYANGADVFLQGLLSDRKMGTCASMPVLYVAVARRLGYPVYLVAAKGHLFCRWEDDKERVNFEGTGEGISSYPDDHYRKWPFPITGHELKNSTYLKNLNPQQELAVFLSNRADCLLAAGRNTEALTAVSQALRLVQDNGGLSGIIHQMAFRPIIPGIVFQWRNERMSNSNPPAQNPHFPHVPLPPDPTPQNPNPLLPKPLQPTR